MELDKVTIISGVGLDINEQGQIVSTFQMLRPISAGSQGEATEDEKVLILEETGETVFDTIRNASMHASRKLYFAHNQVIILGKEAAKKNAEGLLRTFRRDPESRTLDYILIAENTASEILNGKGALSDVQAQDLGSLVGNYKASGKVVPIRLKDISAALLSKTTSPVVPIVKLDEDNRSYLSGTAILKDNFYVGELNDDETRGFLWITNQLGSGMITVEDKEKDMLISFEIVSAKASYKVSFNEKITFEINIKSTTNLGNNMKSTKEFTVDELIKLQEDVVKNKVKMTLEKARYYEADIFGFGDYIHANYPKEWKKIENDWIPAFTSIEYKVNVEIKLKGHGLIKADFKED